MAFTEDTVDVFPTKRELILVATREELRRKLVRLINDKFQDALGHGVAVRSQDRRTFYLSSNEARYQLSCDLRAPDRRWHIHYLRESTRSLLQVSESMALQGESRDEAATEALEQMISRIRTMEISFDELEAFCLLERGVVKGFVTLDAFEPAMLVKGEKLHLYLVKGFQAPTLSERDTAKRYRALWRLHAARKARLFESPAQGQYFCADGKESWIEFEPRGAQKGLLLNTRYVECDPFTGKPIPTNQTYRSPA